MKLLKSRVYNFGSYKILDFDFEAVGLGLVYGSTGSGKSTLQDIPAWILFGVTSKEGSVDEVRNWAAPPGDPTTGWIEVQLTDGLIKVVRTRGKASENDLYWTEDGNEEDLHRGKDMADTQRLLEQRLGFSAAAYLSGAIFHEFSPAGNFFLAKAKDRRAVFDGIANLSLPVRVAEASSEARKAAKKEIADLQTQYNLLEGRLAQISETQNRYLSLGAQWEKDQRRLIDKAQENFKNFEVQKAANIAELSKKVKAFKQEHAASIDALIAQIDAFPDLAKERRSLALKLADNNVKLDLLAKKKCKECGGPANPKEKDEVLAARQKILAAEPALKASERELTLLFDQLSKEEKVYCPYVDILEEEEAKENHCVDELERLKAEKNPYEKQYKEGVASKKVTVEAHMKTDTQLRQLTDRFNALQQIYDLSFSLRAELLRKAVKSIQDETNGYLDKYFDAELRVAFTVNDDNLDVAITKNGFPCVYRQLSKGQRQLLKLSFVISIMKATANRSGVHFANLMFDEALDGLDADLKVKAFSLFQELEMSHETVLLIDHNPEFQNLFSRRFHVSLTADESVVSEESNE